MRIKQEKEDIRKKIEIIRERKKRTLNFSIKEGSAASVSAGVGNTYITPYALALNANNAQIGFLSSFVGLIGPSAQLLSSKLMGKFSRKKIILRTLLFESLMWIPVLSLTFFFWRDIGREYLPAALIIFYTLLIFLGSFSIPSWFSLLGDLVPTKIRGKYFAKRNRICGTILLISTLAASFLLDFFKTKGILLFGFSVLFSTAIIFRLVSRHYFTKHYYPRFKLKKKSYFTLFQFVKRIPKNNFGRFVIFVSLMRLAQMIAGPFFAVYMLKDLGFSYKLFILVNMSAPAFSLLIMPFLGKLSDFYGNKELIKISSILVPAIPFLWIFSKSPIYLIFGPQLVAGISWAGFNLAANNFVYDSVSHQKRGLCIAYYNMLSGIGIFIGAGLGGILAQNLNITFMNTLLFVFFISGVARVLVSLLMLPRIKEVRKVGGYPKLFSLIFRGMRHTPETLHEHFWTKNHESELH